MQILKSTLQLTQTNILKWQSQITSGLNQNSILQSQMDDLILNLRKLTEQESKLNLKIKFRESFRPFAPAVLAEDVNKYFELDCESPYMLIVAPVKNELRVNFDLKESFAEHGTNMLPIVNQKRSSISSVTHVDYSARVQTINKNDHERFYRLIEAFKKETGCSVLINTSFNVRGEPIVCSPQDAYRCFMRTDMDILVLENCILYKENQPEFIDDKAWRDEYELD